MVEIITLGDFDIIVDGSSITDYIASQKRLLKLLKYFLIHNEIKLLPENIIEDLWGDEDFKNPLNMLRTQISRLRRITDIEDKSLETFFDIKYVNGYYIFELLEDCVVDFINFEKSLERDFLDIQRDIEKDFLSFRDLILTYKGSILKEMQDEEWLVPIRSRFARMYVKGLTYYIEHLKENFLYSEIIHVCEKAIQIKPYEEIIHLSFMEALVNLDQHSYALIHYEYFTKKLYNDLGIAPSKSLTQLYKKIKNNESDSNEDVDLNKIDRRLVKKFDYGGVIFCDVEYFTFIYNYERRNKDRRLDKTRSVGIGIITLYSREYMQLTQKELNRGMDVLKYVLLNSFRQGDVVAKWNDNQMVILLDGLREEHIKVIVDKINNVFNKIRKDMNVETNVDLNIKISIL